MLIFDRQYAFLHIRVDQLVDCIQYLNLSNIFLGQARHIMGLTNFEGFYDKVPKSFKSPSQTYTLCVQTMCNEESTKHLQAYNIIIRKDNTQQNFMYTFRACT